MLLQFNFKNYKSFRDDTTLDMTAAKITELDSHIMSSANENVLPAAAVFGANASGKSNVIEAFRYMALYVINSLNYGGEENYSSKNKNDFFKPSPFLFDTQSRNEPSSFEVYFTDPADTSSRIYNYGFSVNSTGICEEWLNSKAKTSKTYKRIFYRDSGSADLSGLPEKVRENIEIALEKETLVVSLGSKLKVSKLKFVRDWFLSLEFADFGEPLENLVLSNLLPNGFTEYETIRNDVVSYLSMFDKSIVGFNTEVMKTDDGQEHVNVDALHKMTDSEETASIPLRNESAGTLKMFAMYQMLCNVLASGSVFFIDELNARLHPLLVRAFVIIFLDPETNPKNAQLIFTSHDSWQLSSNFLRRDEIWFTEKNADGVSSLYSLVDFVDDSGTKIRKDENYEKNYLLGKYGAVPTLSPFVKG